MNVPQLLVGWGSEWALSLGRGGHDGFETFWVRSGARGGPPQCPIFFRRVLSGRGLKRDEGAAAKMYYTKLLLLASFRCTTHETHIAARGPMGHFGALRGNSSKPTSRARAPWPMTRSPTPCRLLQGRSSMNVLEVLCYFMRPKVWLWLLALAFLPTAALACKVHLAPENSQAAN